MKQKKNTENTDGKNKSSASVVAAEKPTVTKAKENTTEKETTTAKAPSNKRSSSSNALAFLAFILACIALLSSGYLWYQSKERMEQKQGAEDKLAKAEETIESLIESQEEGKQYRQQMQVIMQEQIDAISSSDAQVIELTEKMAELEKGLLPEKDRLLLARVRDLVYQAQSIITVSNQNIGYVRDLLLEAQGILSSIKDPDWDNLRRALVIDIDAIESVKTVDSVTVYEQVESLRRAVRSLGFLPEKEKKSQDESLKDGDADLSSDYAEPASLMENFAKKIADQLKSMVVIRENQDGIIVRLNADSFQHVKLLIESGLSQAQLALMQHNQESFEKSLIQVQQTIEKRLSEYKVNDLLAKIEDLLVTDVFESPASLESYPELKAIEEQKK